MLRTSSLFVAVGLLAVVTGACASTTPSTTPPARVNDDFAGRIGNYKYDQAISDLGPPSQQRELPTGETVCTWPRKGNTSTYTGPPTSYGTTSPGVQENNDIVILTFDSRKVLVNCVTQPEKPAPDASWQ